MIQELYSKLNNNEFLAPGGIAYNFYIVPYEVRKEAETLADIDHIVEDLRRPTDFIDVLSLDLFSVFLEYLDADKFGNQSRLAFLLDSDARAESAYLHTNVTKSLFEKAHSEQFRDYVHAKIVAHFSQTDPVHKRPYVFLWGFGAMFPYLRANEFLIAYEAVNDANLYKVILFYPGTVRDGQFSLFGVLNDQHAYRAQILEIESESKGTNHHGKTG
ncbi:MAG: DUF1788 domain-containing protein [Kiritimatiellae bacterium]|nr:DUF1788 domain-containing protein [Kiritimatiellia bacterium]